MRSLVLNNVVTPLTLLMMIFLGPLTLRRILLLLYVLRMVLPVLIQYLSLLMRLLRLFLVTLFKYCTDALLLLSISMILRRHVLMLTLLRRRP